MNLYVHYLLLGGGGGPLNQILVGDVPSRLQEYTFSLYQFFEKVYPTLYQFFRKSVSDTLFHRKILKIGTVAFTKIVKSDTVLYTNLWKIDTLSYGIPRTQNICSAPLRDLLPPQHFKTMFIEAFPISRPHSRNV